MTDPRERVCWSARTATATLSTEAVSPSTSVFLATHAPLRIRRRHPDLLVDDLGQAVDEKQVRDDFFERTPVNGVLLMPVIGESGTGKSHLVRWIYERTKRDKKSEHRVVIHVPKASTSLRALVNVLLDREDIVSEKLTQLRRQVDDLASSMDEQSLQRHLLFALAEAVAAAEPHGNDRSRRALVGPTKLAQVLRDVHVGTHLMKQGALIPRLAASLLNDRADGESDRPTQFTVEDLPHIADVGSASIDVRELLSKIMSQPRLQRAAADLLTELLSTAVQAVFKLGGRLQDAMLTIRAEYQRQGKEIVLLIEDFAVIQGLQRDLLDALIEPGVREGRQVLAPVRTLMAVTTGYYRNLADTVVTRAQASTPYVYDLDMPFDPSEEGQSQIAAFVGRYLNAARIGWEQLDSAGVAAGEPVPNACVDCTFRVSCHEAFGASSEEHGLFPFNWPALRRAIRSSTPPNSEAFNPRAVIGRVIRPVLEDAESLIARQFPGPGFRELFPLAASERGLAPSVKVDIEDRDAVDAERRTTLLEFWGDAPTEVRNLDPGIHEAFAISPLTLDPAQGAGKVRQRTQTQDTRTPKTNSPGATMGPPATGALTRRDVRESWPGSLRAMVDDVDEWEAGRRPLLQGTASRIRSIVAQAVVNRCDWTDPLMAEPSANIRQAAWPPKSSVVSILHADAENLASDATPIKFVRNPRNAVFFRHLLTLEAGVDDPGNGVALRRLRRIAKRHQGDLKRAVLRSRRADDDDLVLGLTASLIGAALAGQAWPGMSDAELVAAAFDDGTHWQLADASIRTERWVAAWRTHGAHRGGLVRELRQLLGVRRGTGAVRIVDAARVLPLLRRAANDWVWPSGVVAPEWCRKAVDGFRMFDNLVTQQLAELKRCMAELNGWLPAEVSGQETVVEVDKAFRAAMDSGLAPPDSSPTELFQQIEGMKALDWQVVDQLRRDLGRVETSDDAVWRMTCIAAAARDRGAGLAAIVEFLRMCDQWLTTRLADAELRRGGAGEAAAQLVREARAEWEAIVGGPR